MGEDIEFLFQFLLFAILEFPVFELLKLEAYVFLIALVTRELFL